MTRRQLWLATALFSLVLAQTSTSAAQTEVEIVIRVPDPTPEAQPIEPPPDEVAEAPEASPRSARNDSSNRNGYQLLAPSDELELDPLAGGAELVIAGGLFFAAGAFGVGYLGSQLPTFHPELPDWAAAVTALSLDSLALGMLALSPGLAILGGHDGVGAIVATSAAEAAVGLLLGAIAIGIAPGIGTPWGDSVAQQRMCELLAMGSVAFQITGALGLAVSAIPADETTEPKPGLRVAPYVNTNQVGVAVGGHF